MLLYSNIAEVRATSLVVSYMASRTVIDRREEGGVAAAVASINEIRTREVESMLSAFSQSITVGPGRLTVKGAQ